MATTPQGNFAAYKELKYREQDKDNSVDFINMGINRLIADGKAREATKLKQAQEQGKGYYEMIKDIKIDPITSISAFQDYDNQMYNQTINALNEAKIKSLDTNVPLAEKQRLTQKALQMQNGYAQMKTFLGNEKQLDTFKSKLETDTSKIWKGDKGLSLMTALKSNAMWVGYDKNGNAVVKYLDPNEPSNLIPKEMSFSEATQSILNPYEEELINKKDGLYDQMKQEAVNMSITTKNGIGGNRTTETLQFNPKDAEKSFDIRFGDYNLNNPDKYLQQFAFDVLNGGEIKSREDWDKVKKAYVDKMDSFVKEETSTVDKYTAAQLEEQNLNNKKTRAQIQKMQEKEQLLAVPTAETSIIRTYNPDGSYQGYYTGKTAAVNLAGTTNFLSAQPVEGKDGKVYNKYYIGGFAKDGNIVYEPLSNPMTAMTSAKIKDPIKVFAQLNDKAKSLTPIKYGTRQKIVPKSNKKAEEYELTSVNIKAKSSEENAKKDFENALYQGLLDNQNQ